MPSAADLLAVPTEFEFEGKVYHLLPPTQIQQGKYQRYLERNAWEALDRSAEYRDPAAVKTDRESLTAAISAGEYEWDGPVGARAQQTPDGAAKLLQILLDVDAPTADRMALAHIAKFSAMLLAMQGDDPKALALALAALGLPKNFLDGNGGKRNGRGSSRSKTRRSTGRKKKSAA